MKKVAEVVFCLLLGAGLFVTCVVAVEQHLDLPNVHKSVEGVERVVLIEDGRKIVLEGEDAEEWMEVNSTSSKYTVTRVRPSGWEE